MALSLLVAALLVEVTKLKNNFVNIRVVMMSAVGWGEEKLRKSSDEH